MNYLSLFTLISFLTLTSCSTAKTTEEPKVIQQRTVPKEFQIPPSEILPDVPPLLLLPPDNSKLDFCDRPQRKSFNKKSNLCVDDT